MVDQVNGNLAFVLENVTSTTTETITTVELDFGFAELGLTVGWWITSEVGTGSSAILALEESNQVGGVFTPIPDNRLIGSEFFVKEFGKNKLFQLDKATTGSDASSFFQILELKNTLRAKIDTTIIPTETLRILVVVFAHVELSPVIKNNIPFALGSP